MKQEAKTFRFATVARARLLAPLLTVAGVVSLLAVSLLPSLAATGSGSLSLSPASGSYNPNATFAVNIIEDSGNTAVNTVVAKLSYDQSKLQVVSVTSNSSAFGIEAENNSGNGAISLVVGNITGRTGQQTVGTITFKANASGTAAVNYANGSQLLAATDSTDILATTTGASFTVNTPAPQTCPSGQIGTPPNCATPTCPSGQAGTYPNCYTPSTPVTQNTNPTPAASTTSTGSTVSITPNGSNTPVTVGSGSQVQVSAPATLAPTPAPSNDGGPTVSIVKAEYYLDKKLLASVTKAPYKYKLNTTHIRNGQYTLTTKTYYSDGTISTSSQRLTVKNPASLTQAALVAQHYALPTGIILAIVAVVVFLLVRNGGVLGLWNRLHPAANTITGGPQPPVATPPTPMPPVTPPTTGTPGAPGSVITPTVGSDEPNDNHHNTEAPK